MRIFLKVVKKNVSYVKICMSITTNTRSRPGISSV